MGRKSKIISKKSADKQAGPGFRRPVFGILLGGAALVSLLGLGSYRPRGAAENWAGPVGHSLARVLLEAAGVGGYAAAIFLLALVTCKYFKDALRAFCNRNII